MNPGTFPQYAPGDRMANMYEDPFAEPHPSRAAQPVKKRRGIKISFGIFAIVTVISVLATIGLEINKAINNGENKKLRRTLNKFYMIWYSILGGVLMVLVVVLIFFDT